MIRVSMATALMYAFAQRADATVVDEPLYAHDLSTSSARLYHPGADEVIAPQENDWRKVVKSVLFGSYDTPIVFFKSWIPHRSPSYVLPQPYRAAFCWRAARHSAKALPMPRDLASCRRRAVSVCALSEVRRGKPHFCL